MRFSFLLPLFLALGACSGEGSDVSSDEAAVVGGTAANDDHAVVALLVEGDRGTALCTGTFVSPHVVVTAAHCITNEMDDSVAEPSAVRIHTHATITSNDATLAVTAVHPHPQFTRRAVMIAGTFAPIHDVAVLRTVTAFSGAPLPFARSSFAPSVGSAVRLVGYGASSQEIGATIRLGGMGRRRALGSEVTSVDDLLFIDDAGRDRGSCVGDSGGPVLGRIAGQESVIGIISFSPTQICSGPAINARLDVAASFVEAEIDAADPGFLSR